MEDKVEEIYRKFSTLEEDIKIVRNRLTLDLLF